MPVRVQREDFDCGAEIAHRCLSRDVRESGNRRQPLVGELDQAIAQLEAAHREFDDGLQPGALRHPAGAARRPVDLAAVSQVKGYPIDSALLALPGVTAAAAAVRRTATGNQILVGYLTAAPEYDAAAATAHLRATMPAARPT